jgi:GNAT superfamily N-acetyltransferase
MAFSALGLGTEPDKLCTLLAPDDEDAFAQLLAIYKVAIIASEQKSDAELSGMLGNPRYRVLVAREDRRVIGFAILYFPAGGAFWLLEYMAVDQRLRSKRYGERIFAAAKNLAESVIPGAPCVLEVDQSGGKSADDDASRRLRFYRKLGCRRIEGLAYILPLKAAGTPPPMMLLVHGLEDRESLAAAEVSEWLRAIYVDVYGQRPDDPRVITMMSHGVDSHRFGLARDIQK